MGVQISRGLHSQVQEEDAVRAVATASWRGIPEAGRTEGKPDRGGASVGRSRAYLDSAETFGLASDRFYQRKERHSLGARVWRKKTKLRRPKLLGARFFRVEGRTSRGRDTRIHQEPGE